MAETLVLVLVLRLVRLLLPLLHVAHALMRVHVR